VQVNFAVRVFVGSYSMAVVSLMSLPDSQIHCHAVQSDTWIVRPALLPAGGEFSNPNPAGVWQYKSHQLSDGDHI